MPKCVRSQKAPRTFRQSIDPVSIRLAIRDCDNTLRSFAKVGCGRSTNTGQSDKRYSDHQMPSPDFATDFVDISDHRGELLSKYW